MFYRPWLVQGRVVPYFETVIRYLGGLLSAYALSHEKILLDRADQLATQLDGVFDSPSGLPYWGINPTTFVACSAQQSLIR